MHSQRFWRVADWLLFADLIYQHYRGRLFIKRRPASPSNGDGLDPLQQPELVPDQAASAAAASTALATATAAAAAASATEFRMNKDRAYSVARTAAKALRGGDASSDAQLELNPEFQKRFGLVYEQYRPSLFWYEAWALFRRTLLALFGSRECHFSWTPRHEPLPAGRMYVLIGCVCCRAERPDARDDAGAALPAVLPGSQRLRAFPRSLGQPRRAGLAAHPHRCRRHGVRILEHGTLSAKVGAARLLVCLLACLPHAQSWPAARSVISRFVCCVVSAQRAGAVHHLDRLAGARLSLLHDL